MPGDPGKLSQFWKELKRRNVVRVMTVYAGASFVILELVSMSEEPFGLPDWTFVLAAVLLSIGFLIAIIISWIYDLHPEGGIVKTEPIDKVKAEDIPKSSNNWKIASYISFVVIVGLIVLNIIPRIGKEEILEKSIAVLPFNNESSDQENTYFINGMMESILNNLSRIEELRVVSRNSVEHYRNNPKPTPIVAKEMNVSYVLEGSGQKVGNRLLLTLQLIVGDEDRHIWSRQYDRMIEKVEDLIDIQKEIAELVVDEIEAVITPQERELIENVPTTSLTAYDFYQRGYEESWRFYHDDDITALGRAEIYYQKALNLDSSYARAYTGLAWIYHDRHSSQKEWISDSFADSVIILANIALSYDSHLAEAYELRGYYYFQYGKPKMAVNEYNKAIKYNPNYYEAYWGLGILYLNELMEYDLAINYLFRASLLHRGNNLPVIYKQIADAYRRSGFYEQAKAYNLLALELDADTAEYLLRAAWTDAIQSNYKEAIQHAENSFHMDSSNMIVIFNLGAYYLLSGELSKSLIAYQKYETSLREIDAKISLAFSNMGFVYWHYGFKEKADSLFNMYIHSCNEMDELDRPGQKRRHFELAKIYAFTGKNEKAYEYLDRVCQSQGIHSRIISNLHKNPMFDYLRDEPEFKQIIRDVESRSQAEHERVRQWLKENDML